MDQKSENPSQIDRKNHLKMPYMELDYRPVSERIRDFQKVTIHFDEERAIYEASRFLQCPAFQPV